MGLLWRGGVAVERVGLLWWGWGHCGWDGITEGWDYCGGDGVTVMEVE